MTRKELDRVVSLCAIASIVGGNDDATARERLGLVRAAKSVCKIALREMNKLETANQ